MVSCSFCHENYEFPRGTTVVLKDANVRHYCSSKCRKNAEMGRLSKKVSWVKKSSINKKERAKKEAMYKARVEEKKALEEKRLARKTKKKK